MSSAVHAEVPAAARRALDAAPALGQLTPGAPAPFHHGSTIRQVAGEPVVGMLLMRALAMEVAHPKVGAGVQEHSRFRVESIRRGWSTLDAGLRLVFGNGDIPRRAAEQVYRVHDHIFGSLPAPSEPWSEGDPYTAHDATLLLWVWATLVDTSEVAFTRWVRPWEPGEADAYYADMVAFARFFGIPASLIPPDRAAFSEYFEDVLANAHLGATATSKLVAHDVVYFDKWYAPAALLRPGRVLSVGLLDPRLRDALDVHLSPSDERLFKRLDALLKRTYHRLPAARTRLPDLYLLLRRPSLALFARA
jgi:uncharacterized protein (DUF2236 family)